MRNCDHLNAYFRTISKDLRDAILFFAKREDADLTTERGRDLIVERARRLRDLPTDCRVICYKLIAQGYASDEALDHSFDARNLHDDSFEFYESQIDAGTPPGEAFDLASNVDRVEMCEFYADAGTRRFIRSLIESGYCPQREEDADKIVDYARQYESLNDDETREAYSIARQDYGVEEALKIARRLNYVMADAYELYRTLVRNGTDAKEAAEQANTFDDFSEDAQELYFDLIDREDVTAQSLFDIVERYNALDENTQDAFKHLLDPDASGTVRTAEDAISDAETLADYMCFISDTANPEDVGYGVWDNLDGASFSWLEDDYIGNYFNLSRYCARTGKSEEEVNIEELDRKTLEEFFDFAIYGREFLNEHETFTDRYGALWYIYN